jgi:hypothetical protein
VCRAAAASAAAAASEVGAEARAVQAGRAAVEDKHGLHKVVVGEQGRLDRDHVTQEVLGQLVHSGRGVDERQQEPVWWWWWWW